MRRRELDRRLRKLGFYLLREGSKHTIWTNGVDEIAVPRHREINEYTAKAIIELAKGRHR